MLNFKLIILISSLFFVSCASAGTILLLKAGKGSPGSGGTCSNSLDYSDGCNLVYNVGLT